MDPSIIDHRSERYLLNLLSCVEPNNVNRPLTKSSMQRKNSNPFAMIPNGAGSSSDMILVGHGSTDAKARAKQDRAQAALASLNPFANTAPPAPSSGTKLNIARQHSDTIIYKKGASMNAMKAQQVKQHSAPNVNLDAFDPFSMNRAQQPQTRVQTQARQTSQSFDPFAQSFGAMSFDSPPKRHQKAPNPASNNLLHFEKTTLCMDVHNIATTTLHRNGRHNRYRHRKQK